MSQSFSSSPLKKLYKMMNADILLTVLKSVMPHYLLQYIFMRMAVIYIYVYIYLCYELVTIQITNANLTTLLTIFIQVKCISQLN